MTEVSNPLNDDHSLENLYPAAQNKAPKPLTLSNANKDAVTITPQKENLLSNVELSLSKKLQDVSSEQKTSLTLSSDVKGSKLGKDEGTNQRMTAVAKEAGITPESKTGLEKKDDSADLSATLFDTIEHKKKEDQDALLDLHPNLLKNSQLMEEAIQKASSRNARQAEIIYVAHQIHHARTNAEEIEALSANPLFEEAMVHIKSKLTKEGSFKDLRDIMLVHLELTKSSQSLKSALEVPSGDREYLQDVFRSFPNEFYLEDIYKKISLQLSPEQKNLVDQLYLENKMERCIARNNPVELRALLFHKGENEDNLKEALNTLIERYEDEGNKTALHCLEEATNMEENFTNLIDDLHKSLDENDLSNASQLMRDAIKNRDSLALVANFKEMRSQNILSEKSWSMLGQAYRHALADIIRSDIEYEKNPVILFQYLAEAERTGLLRVVFEDVMKMIASPHLPELIEPTDVVYAWLRFKDFLPEGSTPPAIVVQCQQKLDEDHNIVI